MSKNLNEYRGEVLTHLEYIKEKVDVRGANLSRGKKGQAQVAKYIDAMSAGDEFILTNIMVMNENKIISDQPDYVIILAWHLKKRIINLLSKKGYKGKFIVPLPNLTII